MRTLPPPTDTSLEALRAENEKLRRDLAAVQERLKQEQARTGAYARVATERLSIALGLLPPPVAPAPPPAPSEDRRRRIAASGLTGVA